MAEATTSAPPFDTLADLVAQLGGVPLQRILMQPAPRTATEHDVLRRPGSVKRLCELVDGVLVEKTAGYYESRLAGLIVYFLETFLNRHDLGIVLGSDGTLRLKPGLVRVPDVSFISWNRLPGRILPDEPIPDLAPDLAVEVLSKGNTEGEMARKLEDYFRSGSTLVWFIEPATRSARVYTGPDQFTTVAENGVLEGGNVLPGFALSLQELFDRAGRRRSD